MGAHHYLPFRGLVGRSVRHVAVLGEHWLALVGWHAGAFKLKARDRWIGWLPEQQFRRLHLIANNARFLILRRGEPRFAGAGAEPSPALGRLPRNAWAPDFDRRDVRGSKPIHRGMLPGGELASAGANPRLCPQAWHARDLGPPRQTEGGSGLPAGPRRARAALPPRMPQSGEAKATRDRGPLIDCEACGSVFMVCPISAARAGGAIRWPPS